MRKIFNEELGRPTLEEYAGMRKLPVTVMLENIRSMNNVGSFFRTCDAFGIEKILLCGITSTPPNREIHKTALGAEDTVEWDYSDSPQRALQSLLNNGYTAIAVEQAEGAVSLEQFVPAENEKYVLIFGNEVDGVEQQTMNMCSGAIEIPQVGTKHSLNVSVAGGVVLWHFFCRM